MMKNGEHFNGDSGREIGKLHHFSNLPPYSSRQSIQGENSLIFNPAHFHLFIQQVFLAPNKGKVGHFYLELPKLPDMFLMTFQLNKARDLNSDIANWPLIGLNRVKQQLLNGLTQSIKLDLKMFLSSKEKHLLK